MTRTELIAALEAAEGPSRELDAEIELWRQQALGLAAGWKANYSLDKGRTRGWLWDGKNLSSQTEAPHYTESIDAALSFTPEGEQYCLGCLSDTRVPVRGIPRYHAWVGCTETVYGATPAIALCIANLRALEAQEEA